MEMGPSAGQQVPGYGDPMVRGFIGSGKGGAGREPPMGTVAGEAVRPGNAAMATPTVALCAPALCLGHQGKLGVLVPAVVRQGREDRVNGGG